MTGLPVVPIRFETFHFWNRRMAVPNFKRNIKITIGKPRTFKGKPTRKAAMAVARTIMADIRNA